jgi:hypothetical protein
MLLIILLAMFTTTADAKARPHDPKARACWVEVDQKLPAIYRELPPSVFNGIVTTRRELTNGKERRALHAECMKGR